MLMRKMNELYGLIILYESPYFHEVTVVTSNVDVEPIETWLYYKSKCKRVQLFKKKREGAG